jgi:hypothetical protein
MTTLSSSPESATKPKQPESLKRQWAKFVGGATLAIGVATGPGIALGIHHARTWRQPVEASLALDTALLAAQQANVDLDALAWVAFRGNLSADCRQAVDAFLLTGPNKKANDVQANLSLQQSGICPPANITLATQARTLENTYNSDADAAEKTRTNIQKQADKLEQQHAGLYAAVTDEAVILGMLGAAAYLVDAVSGGPGLLETIPRFVSSHVPRRPLPAEAA